jgi:hypothetical protein
MKKDEKHKESDEDNKDMYKQMTDQEIKQLAEDMYKGLIFTDRHIKIQNDILAVFVPLVLMEKEVIDELQRNPPGMIYEYIDKAGPMAINGMPIFLSLRLLSVDDTKKVFDRYNKIREVIAKV